jgi:hypothetical protein
VVYMKSLREYYKLIRLVIKCILASEKVSENKVIKAVVMFVAPLI